MYLFLFIFNCMLFGSLGSVLCAQRGRKQWIGILLGCTLSILGVLIIKWFFKDKPEGMNDFYKKREIEREKEITHANFETKRLGISNKEYWERENYETRKSSYENRDTRLDVLGNEGMPDKHGNTWVDYFYYFLIVIIILVALFAFLSPDSPPPSVPKYPVGDPLLWDL